jgi:hypothetical protein
VQEQLAVAEEAAAAASTQQTLQYEQKNVTDFDQKMSDMSCSLDNPEGCEACGS